MTPVIAPAAGDSLGLLLRMKSASELVMTCTARSGGRRLTRIGDIRHLGSRAIWLFVTYAAVLAAVVVAGFLGQALGLWAAILWGCGLVLAVATYVKRRAVAR